MKILHLDIETAPNKVYAWGLWGQDINIQNVIEPGYTMCWAAKWHGKKKVMFNSLNQSNELEMLEEIHGLLNEADVVIHYNGTKFDIPILNSEFALNSMPPPDPFHQIDLLRVVRKRFKLPSNKLDFVSQYFGLGSKHKHKGMELWHECMAGDSKAWKQMEKYNKQDVVLLEDLYNYILPWIQNHPNQGLYDDIEEPCCPNCGSDNIVKNGTETTMTMKYQRYKCKDCGTPLRGRSNLLTKEKRASILVQSKL